MKKVSLRYLSAFNGCFLKGTCFYARDNACPNSKYFVYGFQNLRAGDSQHQLLSSSANQLSICDLYLASDRNREVV